MVTFVLVAIKMNLNSRDYALRSTMSNSSGQSRENLPSEEAGAKNIGYDLV